MELNRGVAKRRIDILVKKLGRLLTAEEHRILKASTTHEELGERIRQVVLRDPRRSKSESCRFCYTPAVAVYAMSDGCVCFPDDRQQSLCAQHAMRSEPLGTMEMIEDLTAGKAWTRRWAGRP